QDVHQEVAQVLALPPWVGDRGQRGHQGRLLVGPHLPPSLIPGSGSRCTDPAEHDQRKSLSDNHLKCARPAPGRSSPGPPPPPSPRPAGLSGPRPGPRVRVPGVMAGPCSPPVPPACLPAVLLALACQPAGLRPGRRLVLARASRPAPAPAPRLVQHPPAGG